MDSTAATLFAEALSDHLMWIIFGVVAIIAIASGTLTSVLKANAYERSRREIAAYIAEGSMSAEQGERLMNAKRADDDD
jgi:predicted membrane channel-forming protein YqfA (hemolysin III family)